MKKLFDLQIPIKKVEGKWEAGKVINGQFKRALVTGKLSDIVDMGFNDLVFDYPDGTEAVITLLVVDPNGGNSDGEGVNG